VNRADRRRCPATGRRKHAWTTKTGRQYAGVEVCPDCGAIRENTAYLEGLADGEAGQDPNPERLAYGANRCNDYERGYIDSGRPVPADPNSED
jgi:hypothetical protein